MKFALLGLISAESVNIRSAGAGRGSFSVFYEPPHGGPARSFCGWLCGAPGSFTAGWHEVGLTVRLEAAARHHQRLPALNPSACGFQTPEQGPLLEKLLTQGYRSQLWWTWGADLTPSPRLQGGGRPQFRPGSSRRIDCNHSHWLSTHRCWVLRKAPYF